MCFFSIEGDDWYHPEKITSVIDSFVNTRLNMAAPRNKGTNAVKPTRFGFKSSGAGPNLQDTGAVNKSFHMSGFTKPHTFGSESKPARCLTCGTAGHTVIGRRTTGMKSHALS